MHTLSQEFLALCRQLGEAQTRCSEVVAEQAAELERLQREVVRLRAAVIVRDTQLEQARAAILIAKADAPASKSGKAAKAGKNDQRDKAGAQAKTDKKTPKVVRYTVRRGDTLASIARQFKVDQDDLLRWNRVTAKTLAAGQTLTIQLAQNPGADKR